MLEERFSINGISGTVRNLPKRRAQRGEAQVIGTLMRHYPEINRPIEQVLDDVYATMSFNQAQEFAALVVRVGEVVGLPFAWPHSSAAPDALAAAFEWWLDEDDGVVDAIQAAVKRMERPNGVEGAPGEDLTEAERNDPLPANAAPNGSRKSAKG